MSKSNAHLVHTFMKSSKSNTNATHSWWRHQMKSFSALLAICAVTGHQWIPRTKAIDAELWCFLGSPPERMVFETLSCSLWRHCNVLWGIIGEISTHENKSLTWTEQNWSSTIQFSQSLSPLYCEGGGGYLNWHRLNWHRFPPVVKRNGRTGRVIIFNWRAAHYDRSHYFLSRPCKINQVVNRHITDD